MRHSLQSKISSQLYTVFTFYWRSATVGDLVRLRSSYVPIYMNGNFRQGISPKHGLINYIDTKEKCRHLKIIVL
jgi:hypothetical protein